MLSTDGSNSRANSLSDRPARASSTIRRRYSAGYGGCVFGIVLLLASLPNTLHETGSTPGSGFAASGHQQCVACRAPHPPQAIASPSRPPTNSRRLSFEQPHGFYEERYL